MTKMVYYHTVPPSVKSRLIQVFMGLFGMKRAMEKKIVNNTFSKVPASIPKSIRKRYKVEVEKFRGRMCWVIYPKRSENNTVILFLHGGAYYANITLMHWRLIEKLLNSTHTAFIVPDYPLVPESNCKDTYQFLDIVYAKLISDFHSKKIVFMGDSSGGGLALGFAQKIKNESVKQPEKILLFSPWLDVSMSNPDIAKFEQRDKILNLTGLKIAGENYADDLGITDFRVSPMYGDFSNLGEISIFIGTNDILIADARKLKQMLEEQQIDYKYFEYPKMFHDWVVVSNLEETNEVIRKVNSCLK